MEEALDLSFDRLLMMMMRNGGGLRIKILCSVRGDFYGSGCNAVHAFSFGAGWRHVVSFTHKPP